MIDGARARFLTPEHTLYILPRAAPGRRLQISSPVTGISDGIPLWPLKTIPLDSTARPAGEVKGRLGAEHCDWGDFRGSHTGIP